MFEFLFSVFNALQPFIGWIATLALIAVLVLVLRFGGQLFFVFDCQIAKDAVGLPSISFKWGSPVTVQIGVLNLILILQIVQGRYLLIKAPTPVPVAPPAPLAAVPATPVEVAPVAVAPVADPNAPPTA